MIFLHSSFIQFLLITFVCAQQNQFYENTKGENYQKTPYIQISNYGFIDGFISHSAWTKRPIYNFMGIKYGNIPHEGRFKVNKNSVSHIFSFFFFNSILFIFFN